jgi:hypothetical protein
MTALDYQTALRYDTLVLGKTTFTVQERWTISRERSKLLNEDSRISTITTATRKKVENLLRSIRATNWKDYQAELDQ